MDRSYGEVYSQLYHHHWWWRAREDVLLHELQRLRAGQSFGRILDVGCGDGLFLERLSEFGEVEGLEPDSALVSLEVQAKMVVHVCELDDEFLPAAPYDLILFLDVLEHLDEPEKALRRALDLLSPGGVVLVTVPAYEWLWTTHDDLNQHRTRFTPSSLFRLASAADGTIQRIRHLFMWLVVPKLVLRVWEMAARAKPSAPSIPSAGINALLIKLCRLENRLAKVMPLPLGTSLLGVIEPTANRRG